MPQRTQGTGRRPERQKSAANNIKRALYVEWMQKKCRNQVQEKPSAKD